MRNEAAMSGGLPEAARAPRSAGRGSLLVLAMLLALALVLFWPSIAGLAELWSHPERRTYQHGYLIAAIALWLLYRERRRVAANAEGPSPALLLLAAVGGVAWAVAWNAGLQVVHFLLWPAVFWTAAAGALGLRAGGVLLLPVAYLYFAMPVWDALTPALQGATVLANNLFATVIGMPVLIEGNYIHIPEGSFEIAGGCSGLNYLIVGLAIAALLGEVNRDRPGRRLLLIAIGGGLALVSNWLRVFIIIFAGHVTDMDHYLVRVDHYNFGWVLYAFVLMLFFYVARKLPDSPVVPAADPSVATPARGLRPTPVMAAVVALGLGPLLAGSLRLTGAEADAHDVAVGVGQVELKDAVEWHSAPAIGDWVPVFPGAHAESLVEYSRGESRITAYTATYLRQSQGRELIGHDSRVEGGSRGRLALSGPMLASTDPVIEAMEAEWRGTGASSALIWWTYRIGSRDFTSGLRAQLWYGLASLWSDPVSAIVALRSECRPDCAQARLVLQDFAAVALPELLATAGRTGESLE
jgi:exosortase A